MSDCNNHINRRDLLKGIGLAALAGSFGLPKLTRAASDTVITSDTNLPGHGKRATFRKITTPARVSLVKGNDARDNMYKALKNIEDEIVASIGSKKKILIKPNFVSSDRPLCATSADAVRGILDFLKPHFQGQIIIGESTANRAGNGRTSKVTGTVCWLLPVSVDSSTISPS